MITFVLLSPVADPGLLPQMLSVDDPRPAKEQLNTGYSHGGGWHPFQGFTLTEENHLTYPDDPPIRPIAVATLRNELILLYDYSWVAVIQPDRSFEVCRMD